VEYRNHKDLTISVIGMGCYAASGAYGTVDLDEFRRVIDRARGLGVTFFDTAEAYGDAERLLGEVLRPHRNRIHIATKVGVKKGTKATLTRDYIHRACQASLTALHTSYIDLYQVHFDDPNTPVAETVGALDELRTAGKIRHYGLGHLPPKRVRAYLTSGDVFSILMELSAVARSASGTLLPLCREHNVAAIAFSVTGRGVLTGHFGTAMTFEPTDIRRIDPLFQRERLRSALRVLDRFTTVARMKGVTPVQVAIAWVLHQPGLLCALTGPTSILHLEENLGACETHLTSEELAAFESFLAAEEATLRREQRKSIAQILATDLPPDPESAFADLVYALETSLGLELTEEAQILPTFRELFALRHTLPDSGPQLADIQQRLRAIIIPDDVT
jgi:aryl-alcohol dehydrogenase-like predicted oxidoreductase